LFSFFQDQDSYEIKWRLARALYCYAKTFPNIRDAANHVREAYSYADAAVKQNDAHFAGHKWMSVLLDAKSGLDGLRERVGQLHNVKYHMEKAVELNPEDATSWYILGEYAYGLADLPWYSRTAMTTVLANPPTGTYEEALEYFLKAENTRPGFYSMNLLMLGKCYYNLKSIEKAKEFLELASKINVV
jgi:tetratricopeptide (TPR) repeat protein